MDISHYSLNNALNTKRFGFLTKEKDKENTSGRPMRSFDLCSNLRRGSGQRGN